MNKLSPLAENGKLPSRPCVKPCVDCGEQDPVKFYHHASGRQNGIRCISCHAKWRRVTGTTHRMNLRNKYGLTVTAYEEMVRRQAGICSMCGNTPLNGKLVIDHNHQTNQVRELLCNSCNLLLGYMEVDLTRVQLALEYLKKHE